MQALADPATVIETVAPEFAPPPDTVGVRLFESDALAGEAIVSMGSGVVEFLLTVVESVAPSWVAVRVSVPLVRWATVGAEMVKLPEVLQVAEPVTSAVLGSLSEMVRLTDFPLVEQRPVTV